MDDGVGAACFAKETKHQRHRAPDFFISVKDDAPLLVVAKADRQRKMQLTLLRFIELTALEAGAQKVQFGLGHSPFEPEEQPVVEVGGIVATIFVDHEGI